MSRFHRRTEKKEEKRAPITRSHCKLTNRPSAAFIRFNNNLFCSRNWPRNTGDVQRYHICVWTSSGGLIPFQWSFLSFIASRCTCAMCAAATCCSYQQKKKIKKKKWKNGCVRVRARARAWPDKKRKMCERFFLLLFFTTHSYIIIILLQERAQDTWKWAENIKQ